MGADRKMLTRHAWRGQCACCNGPRATGQIKAGEKREVRRQVFEETDGEAEWLIMDWSDQQELLFDPPPTPEGRWVLERQRLLDLECMGDAQ